MDIKDDRRQKMIKRYEVTYLGRRAVLVEDRTGGPTSDRWIFTRWIDDQVDGHPAGTITARRVKGDGRKPSFQVLVPEYVLTDAPSDALPDQIANALGRSRQERHPIDREAARRGFTE
jgi:hypothetical protein